MKLTVTGPVTTLPAVSPQCCAERVHLSTDSDWDPQNVVDHMAYAVTQRRPRPQYLVGLDAKFKVPLLSKLPYRIVDLILTARYKNLRPDAAQAPDRLWEEGGSNV